MWMVAGTQGILYSWVHLVWGHINLVLTSHLEMLLRACPAQLLPDRSCGLELRYLPGQHSSRTFCFPCALLSDFWSHPGNESPRELWGSLLFELYFHFPSWLLVLNFTGIGRRCLIVDLEGTYKAVEGSFWSLTFKSILCMGPRNLIPNII